MVEAENETVEQLLADLTAQTSSSTMDPENSAIEVRALTDTLATAVLQWTNSMREMSRQLGETLRDMAQSNRTLIDEVVRLGNIHLSESPRPLLPATPYPGFVPAHIPAMYPPGASLPAAGPLPALPMFHTGAPSVVPPQPFRPGVVPLLSPFVGVPTYTHVYPGSTTAPSQPVAVNYAFDTGPRPTPSQLGAYHEYAGERVDSRFAGSYPGFGSQYSTSLGDGQLRMAVVPSLVSTNATSESSFTGVSITPMDGSGSFWSTRSSGIGGVSWQDTQNILSPDSVEGDKTDGVLSEPEEYGEAKVDFTPVVGLPELKTLKTGEEEELVIFKSDAKLYRRDSEEHAFKERGVGELKILKHVATGKARLVMRREAIHKLCANHYLLPGMKLCPMARNPRAFMWCCDDFADEVLKPEVLAVKFKGLEEAEAFRKVFMKCVRPPEDEAGHVETTGVVSETPPAALIAAPASEPRGFVSPLAAAKAGTAKVVLGASWTGTVSSPSRSSVPPTELNIFTTKKEEAKPLFLEEPTVASSTVKPVATAAPSAISSSKIFQPIGPALSFSSISSQQGSVFGKSDFKGFERTGQPLFAGYSVSETGNADVPSGESADVSGEIAAYEPEAEFKPAIPLPDLVEVRTGEEEETLLFKVRAKLYRYCQDPPEFKERGIGDLKILKHPVSGKVRIVMRREQVLKLCANHYLTPDLKLVPMAKTPNAFTWSCNDFADEVLQRELFAAKFKTDTDANDFKQCFEKCVESLAKLPPQANKADSTPFILMDKFKPKAGSWACKDCLVLNEANATTCCCCSKPRRSPAPSDSAPVSVSKPTTFPSNSGATPDSTTSSFSFGLGKGTSDHPATSKPSVNVFSSFQFGTSPQTAKTGPTSFSFGLPSVTVAKTPPVDEKHCSKSDDLGETQEVSETPESGPEPFFEPVMTLPDVEVKTGEEDEEEMHRLHCKLYRFIDGQWKERGIGEIRLLKHKHTDKWRAVMRQEQTLKVCLNHSWPPNTAVSFKDSRSCIWGANDFSDSVQKETLFCARFRSEVDAKLFKANGDDFASETLLSSKEESSSQDKGIRKEVTSKSETESITTVEGAEKSSEEKESGTGEVKSAGRESQSVSSSSRSSTSTPSPSPDVVVEPDIEDGEFNFVLKAFGRVDAPLSASAVRSVVVKTERDADRQSPGKGADFATGEFGGQANEPVSRAAYSEDEDDDVELTYVARGSDELQRRARKYDLPENFYQYVDQEPCPGCIGCSTDEELDDLFAKLDTDFGLYFKENCSMEFRAEYKRAVKEYYKTGVFTIAFFPVGGRLRVTFKQAGRDEPRFDLALDKLEFPKMVVEHPTEESSILSLFFENSSYAKLTFSTPDAADRAKKILEQVSG